jgi:tRNA acetyltransferase TAN1
LALRKLGKTTTVYEFNLLVSCPWTMTGRARREIAHILRMLGDEHPIIERTIARGIIGVKTSLDSREVAKNLQKLLSKDPLLFQYTLKWVPTDFWTRSDMNSMKEAVMNIRDKILKGERWRMTVEKRRYTLYHKIDIIKELAQLIHEKVDLKNPDKILRIDIIGKYAAVSVLSSKEIFTTTRVSLPER